MRNIFIKKYYVAVFVLLLCGNSLYSQAAEQLQPIGIEITSHLGDRQTFEENDLVSFLLNLERDAYITAIYVDASNTLLQLVPNSKQPSNFYQASLFIPIPPQNATYQFKVLPPYGIETLWVFASDTETEPLTGEALGNGLRRITQSIEQVRNTIRAGSKKEYGEAKVSINTRGK